MAMVSGTDPMTKNAPATPTEERRVNEEERRCHPDTDVHRERRREQRRQWEMQGDNRSDPGLAPNAEA